MNIRIEVPMLPPREYSPNWRGHWSQRLRAGKYYRQAVYYSALEAGNKLTEAGGKLPLMWAQLDLTFVFPEERIRDEDNHRARFKPGQDALVTAGLLAGDDPAHLRMGKIAIEVDKARAPLTVIELKEVVS